MRHTAVAQRMYPPSVIAGHIPQIPDNFSRLKSETPPFGWLVCCNTDGRPCGAAGADASFRLMAAAARCAHRPLPCVGGDFTPMRVIATDMANPW
jgi:hypothetical protein